MQALLFEARERLARGLYRRPQKRSFERKAVRWIVECVQGWRQARHLKLARISSQSERLRFAPFPSPLQT